MQIFPKDNSDGGKKVKMQHLDIPPIRLSDNFSPKLHCFSCECAFCQAELGQAQMRGQRAPKWPFFFP